MIGARFKDLALDAADVESLGTFWAAATSLQLSVRQDGVGMLRDDVAEHTIWVVPVPEPRRVKQRAHLHLQACSAGELEALGATIEAVYSGWTVMHDPEGGELCVLPHDGPTLTAYRVSELVVDAAHPEAIAGWWAACLGTPAQHAAAGPGWSLEPGADSGLPWPVVFNAVPEAKLVKNRLHWDVWGSRDTLLAAGATLVRARDTDIRWDVLADPEGNEFCVFALDA
jgi:Glyoxalase-like domain